MLNATLDIFVTGDKDFHKEIVKLRLVDLGAGKILRPPEAVKLLVDRECPFPSMRAKSMIRQI